MAKYIELNGHTFEVIRSKNTDAYIDNHGKDYFNRTSLYDFYENPSQVKQEIWAEWLEWASQMYPTVSNMYVTSASCFMFTIGAYYCNPETYEIIGYIRITRDHNYLYLYK